MSAHSGGTQLSSEKRSQFAQAEAEACDILEFQPAYILSLLRSRDYALAETRLSAGGVTSAAVQRRLDRQHILDEEDREFNFLMSEAALRWHVGSAAVMAQQMQHLLDAHQRPNVSIGIIPWRRQVNVLAGHAFHIYDRRLVLVGTAHTVLQADSPGVVARYLDLFHHLRRHALLNADADAEIRRVMSDYLHM